MTDLECIANYTIEEIVLMWPQAAALFPKFHMRCVGCSLEKFDTLSEALRFHQVPLTLFLNELQPLIQSPSVGDRL